MWSTPTGPVAAPGARAWRRPSSVGVWSRRSRPQPGTPTRPTSAAATRTDPGHTGTDFSRPQRHPGTGRPRRWSSRPTSLVRDVAGRGRRRTVPVDHRVRPHAVGPERPQAGALHALGMSPPLQTLPCTSPGVRSPPPWRWFRTTAMVTRTTSRPTRSTQNHIVLTCLHRQRRAVLRGRTSRVHPRSGWAHQPEWTRLAGLPQPRCPSRGVSAVADHKSRGECTS